MGLIDTKIRAGWITYDDPLSYVDSCYDAGLNTVIIALVVYHSAFGPIVTSRINSVNLLAQRAKSKGMNVCVTVFWQIGDQSTQNIYRPVVFSDGNEGKFACPISDADSEYEDMWEDYFKYVMEELLSTVGINVDGIFLDMEMYGTESESLTPVWKRGHTEDSCFCDYCFNNFINDADPSSQFDPSNPSSERSERKQWLVDNNLLGEYFRQYSEYISSLT